MNFTSTKDFFVLGGVTGLVGFGLSAVTGTGLGGAYAFALLIMFFVLVVLIWPERTRFFIDKRR